MRSGQLVRAIMLGMALVVTSGHAIAAAKKRVIHSAPAPAHRKLTDTQVLAGQLVLNAVSQGENLAQACKRASFKNLAVAMNMNRALLHQEKGEYETSEQFAQRVGKLARAFTTQDTLFCQPLDDNEDLPFAYNADLQKFEVSVSEHQNVWRDVKRLGSYRSKTRMGIVATVHSSADFEYNVDLDMPAGDDDDCAIARSSYPANFSFQIPYSVARAPLLKATGYLAFIGNLVSPYVDYDEHEGTPTLDDPDDVFESTITLHFKPTKLVVVEGSGQEVWTCSPGKVTPNRLAMPKGNAGSWVSNDDYPSVALREGHAGKVGISVSVDADGRVASCSVTNSSGYPELDTAACNTMTRRARFRPATDDNGKPIAGNWSTVVNWSIPG